VALGAETAKKGPALAGPPAGRHPGTPEWRSTSS
jgi:hypothetical protein